jgi:hypothetical protein
MPGSSINFKNTLKTLTGSDEISTEALMEYYEPLMRWLKAYLRENSVKQ